MIAALRVVSALLFALAFTVALAAPAQANSKYAALVIHADSGDVLFSRYADSARYPASLTKMMTLYLLFEELEAGRLTSESELTVSPQAAGQPPSKLGLVAGSTIDVDSAVKALVVKSANDAAVVVAEAISGSEWRFAQKMTEKARALGMSKTTFRNASGLPNSKQRTTARDLARLGQRLVHDFPQYYHYFSTDRFTWKGRTYISHNAVARTFPGAEGLKTGYTRTSGFNLATSASRDGDRLIGIVLGGRSVRTRDAHMREILNTAFASIKSDPNLIASLHRATPAPRLKPTLLAAVAATSGAPTVAGSEALQSEIVSAAAELSAGRSASADFDAIGSLIAAASTVPDDLNEYELSRLAALTSDVGEGDAEALADPQTWHVQIGAYTSKSLAQEQLEAAAAAGGFNERPRAVQSVPDANGEPIYRARFISLSAADAGEVCATLRQRGRSCFVVSEPSTR